MAAVVEEALRAKAARRWGAAAPLPLLGPKALTDRVGLGVRWEDYRDGGELRLAGHDDDVRALVACEGRVCSGSWDGSVRVWNWASGEHERTLEPDSDSDDGDDSDEENDESVYALIAWEGRLISGHGSGRLRAWRVATGACEQVLAGHTGAVRALAVCGPRLASGSDDGSLKVWAAAGAGAACERLLHGHAGWVVSLVGWQGNVASGSTDGLIRVWDAETGARDATLAGHTDTVCALAVHGARLLSASEDGTIRSWALGGAWAPLQCVEACGGATGLYPRCLAVSGPTLVCGTMGSGGVSQGDVRVWGLAELDLREIRPAGANVCALLAMDGEVWGGVGADVAVWGRKP